MGGITVCYLLSPSGFILQHIQEKLMLAQLETYTRWFTTVLIGTTLETMQMPIRDWMNKWKKNHTMTYSVGRTNKLHGDPKIWMNLGDVLLSKK